jgi:hypothetical protein
LDQAALSDEGHPADSQLDRLVGAAPPDIKDEAEILAASAREFRSGNDEAASSEEIQAAADRLDDYIKNNQGRLEILAPSCDQAAVWPRDNHKTTTKDD